MRGKSIYFILSLVALLLGSLGIKALIRVYSWGTGPASGSGAISFDSSDEFLKLKSLHLDASGLLNQSVRVFGEIKIIGNFETYVVIEDESIRLLVDLTHVDPHTRGVKLRAGSLIEIAGKVQSGKNGKVYLIANSVSPG